MSRAEEKVAAQQRLLKADGNGTANRAVDGTANRGSAGEDADEAKLEKLRQRQVFVPFYRMNNT